MPMLDVGFMALDPMLASFFDVTRRVETVDANGRSVTGLRTYKRVPGTVIVAEPSNLDTSPEARTSGRAISIVCRFALCGAATGRQPDQITWNGVVYTVKDVQPHPQFGRGFYQATAESMNASVGAP